VICYDNPILPQMYTAAATVACIYNVDGKCSWACLPWAYITTLTLLLPLSNEETPGLDEVRKLFSDHLHHPPPRLNKWTDLRALMKRPNTALAQTWSVNYKIGGTGPTLMHGSLHKHEEGQDTESGVYHSCLNVSHYVNFRFTYSRPDASPQKQKSNRPAMKGGGFLGVAGDNRGRPGILCSAPLAVTSRSTSSRQHRPKDLSIIQLDIHLIEVKYFEDTELDAGRRTRRRTQNH
jgi:hypothetical protein